MRLLQVKNADTTSINDALRQIGDAFNEVMPESAIILYPEGKTPPTGWGVADGTKERPDLRGHGMAGYVYIVKLL